MDNLPSFITSNFDSTELQQIADAVESNVGKWQDVFITVSLFNVYCSVDGKTIVNRPTYQHYLNSNLSHVLISEKVSDEEINRLWQQGFLSE